MNNEIDIPHPNLNDQKVSGHEGRPSDYAEKPKKRGVMKFLRKLFKGENAVGKVLFGVLDVLPFPNVHEIIKSVLKDPEVSFGDGARQFVGKVDWPRTLIGVALVVAVAMGWVSAETLQVVIEAMFGG